MKTANRHVETLRSIRDNEYMPHDEHGGFAMEREALDAAIAALTPAAGGADAVELFASALESVAKLPAYAKGVRRGQHSTIDAAAIAAINTALAAPAPPPEGETPADARMLRKANHGLVDELDKAEALLHKVRADGGASQTLLLEIEAFLNRGW